MNTLPGGWVRAALGELGQWGGGGTPSKSKPSFWNGTIPWVSPKDMKSQRIHDSEDHITQEAVKSSATALVPPGTILVVTRSGILRHTLPVAVSSVQVSVNQDLKTLSPYDGINSDYVAYALRANADPILTTCSKGGTTVQSIETSRLLRYEIPLAPSREQHAIVEAIETHFTRLDAAVASLERVQANLKRYRASVLKAAVEGRLVPTEAELAGREGRDLPAPRPGAFYVYAIRCDDGSLYVGQTDDLHRRWKEHLGGQAPEWTRSHRPVHIAHYEELSTRESAVAREKELKTGFGKKWLKREIAAGRARQAGYEPASVLLERILEERRRRWQEAELAAMNAKGKTPKDDRWKAKYKEPVAPDTSKLPELPEGWYWGNVDSIAEVQGGLTKGKRRRRGDSVRMVPYLRVANVQRGYLDLREIKAIAATDDEIDLLKLRRGDVLFTEGGDRDKLGRGWVWNDEIRDCIHQNHIFRARLYTPDLPDLRSKFLSWFGNSVGQEYFFDEGKQTTNLASINLTKLRHLPVPIPPSAEQARIEAEVERLLSIANESEHDVSHDLARCQRLRQSILKWAFEGKLVDQDPNDEPAAVLLERIRAEREAVKTNHKNGRSNRRKRSAA